MSKRKENQVIPRLDQYVFAFLLFELTALTVPVEIL
jgi:hypothetical protein